MTDVRARHQAWLEQVRAHLSQQDDVVGCVAFGSTAKVARVDEWSDHDVAIVTSEGSQERYRDGTTWLPEPENLVLRTVEHHGGGKAMYADGHLVEWGVDTVTGLKNWLADDYRVLLDRGGVAEAMRNIATRRSPAHHPQLDRDVALFLFSILHGVGRERRGESVSAGAVVRGDAVAHLLSAIKASHRTVHEGHDRLDHRRRAEILYPHVAAKISRACSSPVEDCARALVAVAVDQLGVAPDRLNQEALDAVTNRLGWPAVS